MTGYPFVKERKRERKEGGRGTEEREEGRKEITRSTLPHSLTKVDTKCITDLKVKSKPLKGQS